MKKLAEASKAIEDGADELDFVINYTAYLQGDIELVREEFVKCTKLSLEHQKVAKWIIEIAALTDEQIADLTKRFLPGQKRIFLKMSCRKFLSNHLQDFIRLPKESLTEQPLKE